MYAIYAIYVLIFVLTNLNLSHCDKCTGKCIFDTNQYKCISIVSNVQNECNPIFYDDCPKGCINKNIDSCVNDVNVDPIYTQITPYSDDNCFGSNYPYNDPYNDPYRGMNYCSCKCMQNPITESCMPIPITVYCGIIRSYWCSCNYLPEGCGKYETMLNCSSAENCYSTRIFVSCDSPQAIHCNDVCKDGCIPSNSDNDIHNYHEYDDKRVCFDTIKAICPDGFVFNQNITYCDDFNRNTVCRMAKDVIEYPYRISDIGNQYKCDYFEILDCQSMNKTITNCPLQCQYDKYRNKCIPLYENTICGAIDITNPEFYDGAYSCDNNTQVLLNITNDNIGFTILCGPKWYYENNGINYLKHKNNSNTFLNFSMIIYILFISFILNS